MSGQVCHTPNGVALNFDVGAQHLTDERLQASQFDNEQLVISCVYPG